MSTPHKNIIKPPVPQQGATQGSVKTVTAPVGKPEEVITTDNPYGLEEGETPMYIVGDNVYDPDGKLLAPAPKGATAKPARVGKSLHQSKLQAHVDKHSAKEEDEDDE